MCILIMAFAVGKKQDLTIQYLIGHQHGVRSYFGQIKTTLVTSSRVSSIQL